MVIFRVFFADVTRSRSSFTPICMPPAWRARGAAAADGWQTAAPRNAEGAIAVGESPKLNAEADEAASTKRSARSMTPV